MAFVSQKLRLLGLALFLTLGFAAYADAAGCTGTGNCYWVGGTGNWSDTAHWATASGGATTGGLPSASDNCNFDTLSNATAYTTSVDASSTCLDFVLGAPLSGGVTWNNNSAIALSGSMNLSGGTAGVVASYSGTITFNATSGTKTLTSNGLALVAAFIFNGAGGTFQLVDTLTTTGGNFTLTAGTFDANNQEVVLNSTATQTLTGSLTFYKLTKNGGGNSGLSLVNAIIVSNLLTLTGSTGGNRILVQSSVVGTPRTITAASVSIVDTDFRDITGAGAASPFTGTRLGDVTGNSGITFTSGVPKYWVGNTGDWNATNAWALTDGGASGVNNYPLPQDTATFTSNSFSANGQTITIRTSLRISSINFSGMTNRTGITFATGANNVRFYGNVGLTTAGTFAISGTGTLTFAGRNTQTVTSNGVAWTQGFTIDSIGGTVQLVDNFTTGAAKAITLTNGTFNSAGFAVNSGSFVTAVGTKTLTLGNTTWTLSGTGTVLNNAADTGLTTTANTGTFKTTDAAGGTLTIAGGGRDWNGASLWFAGAGTELYTMTGANTWKDIQLNEGTTAHTITFPNSTTMVTTFTVSGTATKLVTLQRTGASGTWTIAKSGGGAIIRDYLSISNSTGTPGSTWCAGTHSTNGGGNNGWTFDASCTGSTTPSNAGQGLLLGVGN